MTDLSNEGPGNHQLGPSYIFSLLIEVYCVLVKGRWLLNADGVLYAVARYASQAYRPHSGRRPTGQL